MSAEDAADGDDFVKSDEEDFPPASLFCEVTREQDVSERDDLRPAEEWLTSLERNMEAAERVQQSFRETADE